MNQQQKKQQRVEQTSPYWLDVFAIIAICATFASVTIIMMNMKREIVSIDKEIADLNSKNEEIRCKIENQRKEVEALKDSNAVEFAHNHRMTKPLVGMTRNMDGNYYEDERVMYAKRNGAANATHNVATIQKIVPQFLRKHFDQNQNQSQKQN